MTVNIDIPTIDDGQLKCETSTTDRGLNVRLTGSADTRVKPQLDSTFAKVHREAIRLHATEVAVDLRDLKFMNSSCLKAFVTWLANLQESQPKEQYVIRFISNPDAHWQKRSLAALSCFAISLIRIEG